MNLPPSAWRGVAVIAASFGLWLLMQSMCSPPRAGTRVDLSLSLGRVLAGNRAVGSLKWRNDGAQALDVDRTLVSCPCIGVEPAAATVEPGSDLSIAVWMTTPESWAIERRSEEHHSCTVLFKQGLALMIDVRATVLARPVVSPAGSQATVAEEGDRDFFLPAEVLAPSWITIPPAVVAPSGITVELGARQSSDHGFVYPVILYGDG